MGSTTTITHDPKRSRTARRSRLMVEALECRRLFSATALSLFPSSLFTTLFPAAAGAANVTVGRDGAIWYSANDGLERMGPGGSTIGYSLSSSTSGSSNPIVSNLAFGADQSVWFVVATGSGNDLERLTAAGQVADITGPVNQPIRNLTVSGGALWFTQGDHTIGQIAAGGAAAFVAVPGTARLTGLTAGPDGSIWFAGQAASGQGLAGEVGPDGSVTTYALGTVPAAIAAGHDGYLYAAGGGALWRLATNGTSTQIPVPGGDPQALTAGADGSVWFINANDAANPIVRRGVDGTLTRYATGIPGQPVPNSLAVAPNGAVWFTAAGSSSAGGAVLGGLQVLALISGMTSLANAGQIAVAFNGSGMLLSGIGLRGIVLNGSQAIFSSSTGDHASTTITSNSTAPVGSVVDSTHINEPVRTPPPAAPQAAAAPVGDSADSAGRAGPRAAKAGVDPHGADASKAVGDPATFAGEFSIVVHAAVPPAQPVEPSGRDTEYPYDLSDGRPAKRERKPEPMQRLAAVPFTAAPPPTKEQGSISHAGSRFEAAAGPPSAAGGVGESSREQPGLLTKWWRLAVSASAATGLNTWRRGPLQRVYW